MVWTRGRWIVTATAAAFLAGAIGLLVGVRLAAPGDPAAGSVDGGFLLDMADHHEQAIQMAILELRHGTQGEAHTFAREILYQQAYEIGAMERALEEWGISRQDRSARAMAWMGHTSPVDAMPGMASTGEMDALGDARARDADALFMRLMQDHHRGGVEMAEYAAEHARTRFVRELAARMARAQRLEIDEMERAVRSEGLNAAPAGWTPYDPAASGHNAARD